MNCKDKIELKYEIERFSYGTYLPICMDHLLHSTVCSFVNIRGTSPFSDDKKKSSAYMGFFEYFLVQSSSSFFDEAVY